MSNDTVRPAGDRVAVTPPPRIYTLRVHYGGNPHEADAAVAGAATWLFQALDPDGQHELTVKAAKAERGEPLALLVHLPDPTTGLPGGPAHRSAP